MLSLLLVVMFLTFQGGQADVVLHRQDAREEYTHATSNLGDDGVRAEATAYPIGKAAHHAGHSIDVLAEDKGYLIDEDITQDSTCCTSEGSHDGCYPEGKTGIEGLLYTYYGKESQTDGVEDEEGVVHPIAAPKR